MRITATYDRPGFSYRIDRIEIDGFQRRYYWRRSILRVAMLWTAAGVVAGVIAWGCCS
jgi:hypothetical protein